MPPILRDLLQVEWILLQLIQNKVYILIPVSRATKVQYAHGPRDEACSSNFLFIVSLTDEGIKTTAAAVGGAMGSVVTLLIIIIFVMKYYKKIIK